MTIEAKVSSAIDAINAADLDEPDYEEGLTDLLTNLMHYADNQDFDFDNCLRITKGHHRYETE